MAGGYYKLVSKGARRLRMKRKKVFKPRLFRQIGNRLERATHRALISKQSFNFVPIEGEGYALAQNYAYNFTISDIPDYSSYQQIFDQYKIIKVVITFNPAFTGNDTNNEITAAGSPPTYITSALVNSNYRICFDYDDTSAYSTENDYYQNDTMQSMPAFGKSKTVTLYPKMLMDTSNSTAVSVKPKWIDFDNVSVPHYGLKIYKPVTNLNDNFIEMKMRGTIYFACRNRQ